MSLINPAIAMLSPKFREIARRLIQGESQADIARAMGLSAHAISVVVNRNPLFRRAMSEMQSRADDKVFDLLAFSRAHSQEAAGVIVSAMRDETAPLHVRSRSAKDVLGFAGYSNSNTPQVNIQQNNLTFEQRLARELTVEEATDSIIDTEPIKELEDVREPICKEAAANAG